MSVTLGERKSWTAGKRAVLPCLFVLIVQVCLVILGLFLLEELHVPRQNKRLDEKKEVKTDEQNPMVCQQIGTCPMFAFGRQRV